MALTLSRRDLIQSAFGGLGTLGLSAELGSGQAQAAALGHYAGQRTPGRAKRVISLFLAGGPSQVDLFDPKPLLKKFQGQRPGGTDLRTERQTGGLMPTPFEFRKRGRNGVDVSEILPKLGGVIDDICVIRSMYSFNPTHTPSVSLYHTGSILLNRPSMGSWISYGLGSENQNLPSFVALTSNGAALNKRFHDSFGADDFLDGRIKSMEAAYRMQFEAMDVFDIRKESAATRAMYGENSSGNGCLLARRLVEKGVRYVNVGLGDWDDHKDIEKAYQKKIPMMDQAAAALVQDLKQRGMLDDTIVLWGGEFGRTPVSESGTGRDHNPYGFTMWVAGGGFKGGIAYGATDDFGFKAVQDRVSIHDLHATMLHALGIDHTQLTYRYAGRDFRLTDVFGDVVKGILS